MRSWWVLLFCLATAGLTAQSRWQAGFTGGVSLASNQPDKLRSSSGYLANLQLHYRVARWLDVGAEVGYRQISNEGRRELGSLFLEEIAVTFDYQTQKTEWIVGLAPRLNYRIGQGDLSATLSFGVAAHRLAMEVPQDQTNGENNMVRFANFTVPYTSAQLGYTYWWTKRLGLYGGARYLRSLVSRTTSGATGTNNAGIYVVKSVNGGTEPTPGEAGWGLQEPVAELKNLFLTLGITIRL